MDRQSLINVAHYPLFRFCNSPRICCKRLIHRRQGLLAGLRVLQRAADVDQHELLAGAAEDLLDHGQVQFAAAHHGVKRQPDLRLEIHLALAAKADRVAVEVDAVEVDVLALDAVVDRCVAEGVLVGRADAEDFQQRDHHRQFVHVAVGKADGALAGKRVAGASAAGQIGRGEDFAAEFLPAGGDFLRAAGQIGVGQRGVHGVARLRLQRHPAVAVERAAEEAGGQRPRGSRRAGDVARPPAVLPPIHPGAEQHPAVVDPDRSHHLGELVILVGERIEGQFAARLEVLPVEAAPQRRLAADVFQQDAAATEGSSAAGRAARPTATAAARPAGRSAPGRGCRGGSSRRWDSVRPRPSSAVRAGLGSTRGRRGADRPTARRSGCSSARRAGNRK